MSNRTPVSHGLLASILGGSIALAPALTQATAVFEAPQRFQKADVSTGIDFRPQAESFLRFGARAYAQAALDAEKMAAHIRAFLDHPDAESLARAQLAWREARPAYQRTEMLRFFNGPIDHPGDRDTAPGPETRINAWPLNEAHIDRVRGAPTAGLIYRFDLPLNRETLLRHDQASDETDITTGWHAIEFLLWGQDFNPTGPGQRSWEDYLPGAEDRDRRRRYLEIATELLIDDLRDVAQAWRTDSVGSYGEWLSSQPAIEIVGRGLHGAASLAALEIYGERLIVPLDSGSQEDEHSCFSDNTLVDLKSNLEGIAFFLSARYEEEALGPSLIELIQWKSPQLAKRLEASLVQASAALDAVPEPFDQRLLEPSDSPGRQAAERAAESARQVAVALKAAAEVLGIDIVVPGV